MSPCARPMSRMGTAAAPGQSSWESRNCAWHLLPFGAASFVHTRCRCVPVASRTPVRRRAHILALDDFMAASTACGPARTRKPKGADRAAWKGHSFPGEDSGLLQPPRRHGLRGARGLSGAFPGQHLPALAQPISSGTVHAGDYRIARVNATAARGTRKDGVCN